MDFSLPPSIRVSQYPRQTSRSPTPRSSARTYYAHPSPSIPMSIPSRGRDNSPAPPPLPPPRDIPDLGLAHEPTAAGWQWTNNPHWQGFASGTPGAEQEVARRRRSEQELENTQQEIDPARRPSSIVTVTPAAQGHVDLANGHESSENEDRRLSGSSTGYGYRLHSEKQLERRTLDNSSQAYDRNLLSRIGGPSTPHRSGSLTETSATLSPIIPEHHTPSLKRLSVPTRRLSSFDASSASARSRWGSVTSNAVSPGSYRSPNQEIPEFPRPPLVQRHTSLTFADSISHRGSFDSSIFLNEDSPTVEGKAPGLNLEDQNSGASEDLALASHAGTKRRASSPQRVLLREQRSSVGSAPGVADIYHRRSLQHYSNKNGSMSRSRLPPYGSVSSSCSSAPRTSSLSSSYGPSIASSVTSMASERLSPNCAVSPAIDPELSSAGIYAGAKSLQSSPKASLANLSLQRSDSPTTLQSIKTPVDELEISLKTANSLESGMYICDCCPKKPKKFPTEEDLRLHLMEKQYTCLYCPNRFKNKNEAERHQNSLHLRRHSWSCAALPGVEHAFHPCATSHGATDQCGFCGQEFPNPPQWDIRRDHLSVVHKFRECNQAKKFFRADHFRQHLKHSHAGTSGKWTNQLETACMRDEPLPVPMNRAALGSGSVSAGSGGQSYVLSSGSSTMPGQSMSGIKPETIDENPHE